MKYVLIIQVILTGLIIIFYSKKAKQSYFERLKKIIIENDLLSLDSKEIKYYLLEKNGEVHFIEDIERCLNKLKKY